MYRRKRTAPAPKSAPPRAASRAVRPSEARVRVAPDGTVTAGSHTFASPQHAALAMASWGSAADWLQALSLAARSARVASDAIRLVQAILRAVRGGAGT